MRRTFVVMCVLLLVLTDRAGAVIAVKATMRDVYLGSDLILIGKASRIDKERSSVEVEVVEVLKGQVVDVFKQPAGQSVVVQFVNQAALFERVKEGQTIVIMNARGQARHSVHAGDLWTVAEKHEGAKVPKWNVVAANADMPKTFPGGTASLAEALWYQKEGRFKMLVKWDDGKVFPTGWAKVGTLPVRGSTRIRIGDLDGDKGPEVLVQTAGDTRLFKKKGDSFEEVKPSLPADTLGDETDTDLTGHGLLGIRLTKSGELTTGEGKKQTLWEGGEAATSAVFADGVLGGTVIVAREGGLYRYSLEGEKTIVGGDFTRLTGEKLATYHPADGGKMKNAKLVQMDFNGDQWMDLVVIAENGMFAMLNRGHGAYFASTIAVKMLAEGGPDRTKAVFGSGDLRGDGIESLLALTEDGVLYEAPVAKP